MPSGCNYRWVYPPTTIVPFSSFNLLSFGRARGCCHEFRVPVAHAARNVQNAFEVLPALVDVGLEGVGRDSPAASGAASVVQGNLFDQVLDRRCDSLVRLEGLHQGPEISDSVIGYCSY